MFCDNIFLWRVLVSNAKSWCESFCGNEKPSGGNNVLTQKLFVTFHSNDLKHTCTRFVFDTLTQINEHNKLCDEYVLFLIFFLNKFTFISKFCLGLLKFIIFFECYYGKLNETMWRKKLNTFKLALIKLTIRWRTSGLSSGKTYAMN